MHPFREDLDVEPAQGPALWQRQEPQALAPVSSSAPAEVMDLPAPRRARTGTDPVAWDRRRASWGHGMPKVSVVIPTLNEELNLRHVLPRVPAWVDEVVIVDGRSTDGTVEEARRLLPTVRIVEELEPGKGRALFAGFRAARGDIIVALDADGSMAPEDIPRYVYSLMAGADLVKGSRFIHGASTDDMGPLRRWGNRALTESVRAIYGGRYSDLCYGYFALWRDVLPYLEGDVPGFEVETHISVRALAAGFQVVEVPTFEAERIHGTTNLNTFRDGARVLRTIVRERRTFHGAALAVPPKPRPPVQPAVVSGAQRPPQPATPRLTVSAVVCTHDLARWPALVRAVGSLQAQVEAPAEILVVVDHNEVLERLARRELEGATVIANRFDRGLSGARNTAIEEALGDVVAFLDDDAWADERWVSALVDAYDDESVVGVGGLVEPNWQTARPTWFPREFDWVVGCTYRGLPSVRSTVRNVIGANMSFRRRALELSGGFSAELGRVGADGAGCEETELCIRMRQLDPEARIVFEPSARVTHDVPAARATWSYFAHRCRAEGRSKAVVTTMVGPSDGLASERRYVARTLPLGALAKASRIVTLDGSGLAQAASMAAGAALVATSYARASRDRAMGGS